MITAEHNTGPYLAVCDGCGDVIELEGYTYNAAKSDAKARGWRSDGGQQHHCPVCRLTENPSL